MTKNISEAIIIENFYLQKQLILSSAVYALDMIVWFQEALNLLYA
jgi:hypothetical protein